MVNGGAVSGQVNAANGSSLRLAASISSPTTVYVPNGSTTLLSNDSPNATVAVEGGLNGLAGSGTIADLIIANNANNAGTILLQPTNTNYNGGPGSMLTEVPGYTLINTGTIQAKPGANGTTSSITGNIDNKGTVSVASGAILQVNPNASGVTFTQDTGMPAH